MQSRGICKIVSAECLIIYIIIIIIIIEEKYFEKLLLMVETNSQLRTQQNKIYCKYESILIIFKLNLIIFI